MQSRVNLGKLASTLRGIPIWGCLPGSVAKEMGVRYGDILLSMNGRQTSNVDEYIEARNLSNKEAIVVVFRDGTEHTLRLVFRSNAVPAPQQLRNVAEELVNERMLPGIGYQKFDTPSN